MPAHRRHRPVKKKARTKKVLRKKPKADLVLLEAASRLLRVVERLEALLDRHEDDGDRPTVAMGEASFCPSCGTEEKDNPLRVPEVPCDDAWHRTSPTRCPSCGGPPGSIVEHCMDPWHERHPKA